ncbi:MAG TPA: hypothetical protein DIC60_01205 [Lachnospiraceae bacterium]|nr:hypothetical protein [Lachnospiraceae bacterium]
MDNIARMILEVVRFYPAEEEITKFLKSEFEEEEALRVVERVVQSPNTDYPLFFDDGILVSEDY